MKDTLKFVLAFSLAAALGFAGSIKVWGTNDVLTAADLNANFAHIHNLMVGGHGARLVDADVNAGANIAYTKITRSPYIPRAWARINTLEASGCTPDGGTCAVTAGYGVSAVTHPSPTQFILTLANTGTGMGMASYGSAAAVFPCQVGSNADVISSNPVTLYCGNTTHIDGYLNIQTFVQ